MGPEVAAISMGMSAVSGILGAFGASDKAKAEVSTYRYKSGVARANQVVATENAGASLNAGETKSMMIGMKGAQDLGQIKTIQAASGFDVAGESATATRAGQMKGIQMAEATTMENAGREARSHRVQAANFAAEAGLDEMAATNAEEAGNMNVFSSLLGGATQVGDKWMKYKQAGVFA